MVFNTYVLEGVVHFTYYSIANNYATRCLIL